MSDYNELYISEDVNEFVRKQLNELFGDDVWRLDCYNHIPVRAIMVIPILDNADFFDDDLMIGELCIENKPYLEEDTFGNEYFEYSPLKVKYIVKYEKVVYDEND